MNIDTANSKPNAEEMGMLTRLHSRLEVEADKAQLTDISYRVVDTPIGKLLLASTETGLVRVAFESEGYDRILELLASKVSPRIIHTPGKLEGVARQLDEYFAGARHEFELSLDLRLSTDFRRTVQLELGQIGYGHTRSYAQMAEKIGKPKAVRAVGTACATNPLPIVLPCHRVLRTDGSLGGYLGGLPTKQLLLELENPQRHPQSAPVLF